LLGDFPSQATFLVPPFTAMANDAYAQDKLSPDLDLPVNATLTEDGHLHVYLLPNADPAQASSRYYIEGREPSAILEPLLLPEKAIEAILVSGFKKESKETSSRQSLAGQNNSRSLLDVYRNIRGRALQAGMVWFSDGICVHCRIAGV
jgi:hypothetical protein